MSSSRSTVTHTRHALQQLQQEVVAAAISPQGRDVVVNGIATLSKVAQALNTPETKVATRQMADTMQSLIDFFASQEVSKATTSVMIRWPPVRNSLDLPTV